MKISSDISVHHSWKETIYSEEQPSRKPLNEGKQTHLPLRGLYSLLFLCFNSVFLLLAKMELEAPDIKVLSIEYPDESFVRCYKFLS